MRPITVAAAAAAAITGLGVSVPAQQRVPQTRGPQNPGTDQVEDLQLMHGQKSVLWPTPIDTSVFAPAIRKPKRGKIVSIGPDRPRECRVTLNGET